jgi:hypothetical protein
MSVGAVYIELRASLFGVGGLGFVFGVETSLSCITF